MPTTEEIKKIKLILEKIDAIYKIYVAAGGVEYVLEGKVMYLPAILMHIQTINRLVIKLREEHSSEVIWFLFSKDEVKILNEVTDTIIYFYDGVDLSKAENIILKYIPKIEVKLKKFLSDME